MPDPSETSWMPLSPWAGLLADRRSVAGRCYRSAAAGVVPPLDRHFAGGRGRRRRDAERALRPCAAANAASSHADRIGIVWAGFGQWLVVAQDRQQGAELRESFDGLAATADQSAGRAMLRIGGPRARDALAKGCPIDLHDSVFAPGDVALTSIAHVPVHLWRSDDGATPRSPAFDAVVPRSMVGSFWSWFSASAAEFGCESAP